ncbi:hypothetical protein BDP67DRAFT_593531 [Colletotrichum lupini]|nr:hypothetical protein BDP67DRAFT_593531 [Colletotrichum lupini]
MYLSQPPESLLPSRQGSHVPFHFVSADHRDPEFPESREPRLKEKAQPVQTDPEPDAHALLLYKLEHDTGHPSQHRVRCSQLIFYEYRLSVSSSLTRPRSTLKHPPKLISRILSLFLCIGSPLTTLAPKTRQLKVVALQRLGPRASPPGLTNLTRLVIARLVYRFHLRHPLHSVQPRGLSSSALCDLGQTESRFGFGQDCRAARYLSNRCRSPPPDSAHLG